MQNASDSPAPTAVLKPSWLTDYLEMDARVSGYVRSMKAMGFEELEAYRLLAYAIEDRHITPSAYEATTTADYTIRFVLKAAAESYNVLPK